MNKNRVFRSCHKNVNGGVGGWDQVLTFTGGLKQIVALDDECMQACMYLSNDLFITNTQI